ncbi:hypothetical protein E0K89_005225 [Aquicoccus sp. SCR17]|nr:hypothetical protein [Carideicomes alvinocaridis]
MAHTNAQTGRRVQCLRAFLSAMEQQADTLAEEIDGIPREQWLDWARRKIIELDPLSKCEGDE